MQRFYIKSPEIWNKIFQLNNKDIIHQLTKVLRIKLNDEIIIFNWEENIDFIYKINNIEKKSISLEIINQIKKDSEINFELNLFQAFPNKLDKIEYIIQKGTEIGFTSFNLFRSKRSQKLVLSDNKIERLNKIIIEASEQSWRNKIVKLNILETLPKNIDWENIYFHTKDEKSINIKDLKIEKKSKVNLFVWPEGWWSEEEINNFEKKQFKKVYLGNRILRTETVWNVVWFWIINKD
jgi:16S rRNA (uracil1498-N3)-methyltransferase